MRRWLNSIFPQKKCSAEIAVRALLEKGIARSDIRGADLDWMYRRLVRLESAPDFESVRGTLRGLGPDCGRIDCLVAGVIVETRKHPALEYVVNLFNRRLNIPIQVFCGDENFDFIMGTGIRKLVETGQVFVTSIGINTLGSRGYNALFLSVEFWNAIIARNKILVFQTDAMICSASDYSLGDFLEFDYIGSKWPRRRPVGLVLDGGNGGLSVRDWKKSTDCLSRFPPAPWTGGEDGYFAFHIDVMGGRVGRDLECARFSTQYEFLCKSFGAHNVSCLDRKSKETFCHYCPEVNMLFQT